MDEFFSLFCDVRKYKNKLFFKFKFLPNTKLLLSELDTLDRYAVIPSVKMLGNWVK